MILEVGNHFQNCITTLVPSNGLEPCFKIVGVQMGGVPGAVDSLALHNGFAKIDMGGKVTFCAKC